MVPRSEEENEALARLREKLVTELAEAQRYEVEQFALIEEEFWDQDW